MAGSSPAMTRRLPRLPRRQRIRHRGADIGHRERFRHHAVHDGVEARAAYALIGEARHQQDLQDRKIARRRLADPARPQIELDYIERLLKDY